MKALLIEKFTQIYGHAPTIVTRAPGRIEFIGNHTDYNGGTVLGAAIDRGVWVAVAPRADAQWRFASDGHGQPIAQPASENPVKQTGEASWTNYPLGVIAALPAFGLKAPGGFDFFAWSNLPTGAGLSSSAAIELASALAFLTLSGQEASRETVVKIGRHAENNFVGVPCGILDQGVSGFGQENALVFIDCRGPRFETVPMPANANFWIFNTHTKHALVDGLYAARHRECMEAAKALGMKLLGEVSPEVFRQNAGKLSPVLEKRARHVIEEIARVAATMQALQANDLQSVGQLLTASHRSSQQLFENSTPELDFLVDALIAVPGVYGARLTGGGFGGAVMALTAPTFTEERAKDIAKLYALKYGAQPDILWARTGEGAQQLA